MIHVSLPAGTPQWIIVLSFIGTVLIGLCYVLARLVRAALPETPAERLNWWKDYWKHRRDLRRDRWRRRDQRRMRRHSSQPKRLPVRRGDP
jgi:hypothetical protein